MPYFYDWFNLEKTILIITVIHCDTEVATAAHVNTATAYKGIGRRGPDTIFTIWTALKLFQTMFGVCVWKASTLSVSSILSCTPLLKIPHKLRSLDGGFN